MSSLNPLTFYLVLVTSTLFVWNRYKKRNHRPSLPPGPPADPLIGHLRVIPTKDHAKIYHDWSMVYGDVMHVSALGQSIVVLGSEKAAIDLLDKRSASYSDRPNFPMHDLIGWSDMLAFLHYGEQFHKHRKLSQQPFTRKGCLLFRETQVLQSHVLLHNLLTAPEGFENHARRFATAVIMEITYGHRVASDDDPYMGIGEELTKITLGAGNPGTTPVDIFPILKNLPAWFPGAWFIRYGIESQKSVKKMRNWPFEEVQAQMAAGTARQSFLSMHLEELAREGTQTPQEFEDLKVAASHLYGAGGETTYTSIILFIFAMLLHPDAQKMAQEEIDTVVGRSRLPDFSDRETLPMVECVMQETFRWQPPVPLGIPHRSMADDIYQGMFIPKGSIVVPNVRSMTLDEKIYTKPHDFWPQRYLPKPSGNEEPYPGSMFGFGRRICPGRHLADASLWVAIVNILATFRISYTRDENGKNIIPPQEYDSGISSHPKPFKCEIQPRGPWVGMLIQHAHQDGLGES